MAHSSLSPRWLIGVSCVFLLLLALWSRLFALGQVPSGLSWDEAALGYIGKMTIQTGRDEHLDFLPLSFQSFGDYKAPLAMYITGISTSLLGLEPWAIRLPYALASVAWIVMMGWMGWRYTRSAWHGLAISFFALITPWSWLFGRVAFESTFCLLFFTIFLASWLELRSNPAAKMKLGWWLMAIGSFVAGFYVYHSAKIVFPLTLALIALWELPHWRLWCARWRECLAALLTTLVLLSPLLLTILNGTATARATQTTVWGKTHDLQQTLVGLGQGFAAHLQPAFLVQGKTDTLRHGTGERGVLLWTQFLLLIVGAIATVRSLVVRPQQTWWKKLHRWVQQTLQLEGEMNSLHPSFWIVLAGITLLPAAIGFELPHANRALLTTVPFLFLMYTGWKALQSLTPHDLINKIFVGMSLLFLALEAASFWQWYQTTYAQRSSTEWMAGTKEAVLQTWDYVQAGHRVKFSSAYGQPEIFFAQTLDLPYELYRAVRVPGVAFGPISDADWEQYDVLVQAGTETELAYPLQSTVTRPDGSVAFRFYVHTP